MSATFTPSTSTAPSPHRSGRSVSPAILRPILLALTAIVGIGGLGLGIALVTGATVVFNVLVFTVFTVLWLAFAAALAFSPATLHDAWQVLRALPVVVQGLAWLLFLPILIGLWIWDRAWPTPIRVLLVLTIGAFNIFVFLPRG